MPVRFFIGEAMCGLIAKLAIMPGKSEEMIAILRESEAAHDASLSLPAVKSAWFLWLSTPFQKFGHVFPQALSGQHSAFSQTPCWAER